METKELNLPKTDFSQKANGKLREPELRQLWKQLDVFKTRNNQNEGSTFVLHDGPPYANGSPHMGHCLNKTLKDVVAKYQLLQGNKVDFKLGWDCHGLPTELKVLKKNRPQNTAELRDLCHEFALSQVEVQKDFFDKLGVFWQGQYLTMHKDYELNQLEALYKMFDKGLLYQDEKPVYYSPSSRTVLAGAELEYLEREDTATYFLLPLDDGRNLLVWTTMPWTLWGNKAVCVNDKLEYCTVDLEGKQTAMLASFANNHFPEKEQTKFLGKELEGKHYTNPLNNETGVVVSDFFVSSDAGTGLVHLNPAHGADDYRVCKKHGLKGESSLDFKGNLKLNDQPALEGGNQFTLEAMRETGMVYKEDKVVHQYPHDWRTTKPVFFMMTKQFFLNFGDKKELRDKANNVDFPHKKYRNRFNSLLESRGDWCVSRQRKWGFPLTVFFDENNKPQFDQLCYNSVKEKFETHGSNAWFELEVDELLPEVYKGRNWTKCEDTVDVWLDSGLSWYCALNGVKADLYFEGLDQHRGWFQSSLLTSNMLNGKSPYKTVLTHGFVLDDKGRKMAKSLGNVVDPLKVSDQYNTDVLRLWCLSVDYTNDVKAGPQMFKTVSQTYFKLRNTLRFLLSNLYDFDPDEKRDDLNDRNQTMMTRLNEFSAQMHKAYQEYDFRLLFDLSNSFYSDLSKDYFDLETKSLLYEGAADREERREVQYVFHCMLKEMVKLMAPMLPYLAEDVWQHMEEESLSVFLD